MQSSGHTVARTQWLRPNDALRPTAFRPRLNPDDGLQTEVCAGCTASTSVIPQVERIRQVASNTLAQPASISVILRVERAGPTRTVGSPCASRYSIVGRSIPAFTGEPSDRNKLGSS